MNFDEAGIVTKLNLAITDTIVSGKNALIPVKAASITAKLTTNINSIVLVLCICII